MIRFRDSRYLIAEDGKVYDSECNRFLSYHLTKCGYFRLTLGKYGKHLVHRLIAECYILNPAGYEQVNHINNIRTDNRIENLEWVSLQMNQAHKNKQNRQAKGSIIGNSKLTEEQVFEMRRLYSTGNYTYNDFIIMYNISRSAAYCILTNRSWRHI